MPHFSTNLSLSCHLYFSALYFILSSRSLSLPRSLQGKMHQRCHPFTAPLRHRKSALCKQEGAYKTLTYRKYSWTIDLLLYVWKGAMSFKAASGSKHRDWHQGKNEVCNVYLIYTNLIGQFKMGHTFITSLRELFSRFFWPFAVSSSAMFCRSTSKLCLFFFG